MNIPVNQTLFEKWSAPRFYLRFTLLALVIRLVILGFFVYESNRIFPERMIGGFIFKMNDYDYFLGTVDNYFKHGTMTYYDQVKPFAGRMPGYGIPYMLLRFVFPQTVSLVLLISLQIILSAAATYAFALLSLAITRNEWMLKSVFWLYAGFAPVIIFDIFTLSESFSISSMIFFHYFLLRHLQTYRNSHLFLSGFFLAWAIFLRPFLGTFLPISLLLILIWFSKRDNFTGLTRRLILFLLPFALFEAAWITRNYRSLGRFIPLETSLSESYGEDGAYRTSAIGIRTLINSWGGETGEFYDGSEGWWFHHASGDAMEHYSFAPHVFQAGFNRDSLVQLKYIFNQSVNQDLSRQVRDSLNMLANRIALNYAADYQSKNPLRYYLINPVKMYTRLLFSNGTRLLMMPAFSEMNLLEKLIKFFYLFFYYASLFAGIAGMILFLFNRSMHSPNALLLLFHPWIIATTLVFYASFIIVEYRYLISALPVFILFGIYGFANFPAVKKRLSHSSIP